MNFLKRIELWLLLAVIVAGLAYVFTSGPAADEDGLTESDDPAMAATSGSAPLKLYRCILERDYGNLRLDIDLRVQNDAAEKLVMQAPKVRLLTSQGREVPSFFLSFEPLPEIAPKSTQDVQLRYWLEVADLQGGLTLEIDGKSLPVKSNSPFDLKSLTSGEKKTVNGLTW